MNYLRLHEPKPARKITENEMSLYLFIFFDGSPRLFAQCSPTIPSSFVSLSVQSAEEKLQTKAPISQAIRLLFCPPLILSR